MKAYQLKISIKNSHPPIWRRCIIPEGITFSQLGMLLIEIMGWSGAHLFSFDFYNHELEIYENEGWDDDFYSDKLFAEAATTYINELMESEECFTFIYDFGDDWQHKVVIEKVIDDYPENYAKVIKYKGDCPPEDIGGMWGYSLYQESGVEGLMDMYGMSLNDKKEKARLQELFDNNKYDVDIVNSELKENYYIRYGAGENRSAYEMFEEVWSGDGLSGTTDSEKIKMDGKVIYADLDMPMGESEGIPGEEFLPELEKYFVESVKKGFSEVAKDQGFDEKEIEGVLEKSNIVEVLNEIKVIKYRKAADNFTVRSAICGYTKDELLELGDYIDADIRKSWKKDKMLDVLAEKLTDETFFEQKLKDMTPEMYDVICKMHDEKVYIFDEKQIDIVFELYDIGYCQVLDENSVVLTKEIRELLGKIRNKDFDERRAKIKWLSQCIHYLIYYYGAIPINKFEKLLRKNKKVKIKSKELKEMLESFSDKVVVLDKLVMSVELKDGAYETLLKWQGEKKDYYIPSFEEIDYFDRNNVYPPNQYDWAMMEFLADIANSANAEIATEMIQKKIYLEVGLEEVLNSLSDYDIAFGNNAEIGEFIELYNDMHNNTRMMINKGHTPLEIMESQPLFNKGTIPTLTAGSSAMAEMLEKDRAQIEAMGIRLDLDSNAGATDILQLDSKGNTQKIGTKKVYPNDPCPCGSGKKYKKCCGRP
ncbi:MAG: SEC-C domain-containing protein [Lachnospiraceae bacterium]|nr:SEC-C domain-containing protein [Lachnospiraceae bacterium]